MTLCDLAVLDPGDLGRLLYSAVQTGKSFTFSMCNPPFFASEEERDAKAAFKPPKLAANPVAATDAIVEGGEVGFVSRMIEESMELEPKIKLAAIKFFTKSS